MRPKKPLPPNFSRLFKVVIQETKEETIQGMDEEQIKRKIEIQKKNGFLRENAVILSIEETTN